MFFLLFYSEISQQNDIIQNKSLSSNSLSAANKNYFEDVNVKKTQNSNLISTNNTLPMRNFKANSYNNSNNYLNSNLLIKSHKVFYLELTKKFFIVFRTHLIVVRWLGWLPARKKKAAEAQMS